jgi:acyl-ACP thioesterase
MDVTYATPFESGRQFSESFRIRLADTDAQGVARLDAIARYLQDVATDDWADTGIVSDDTWVVRRTALRVAPGGRRPTYLEDIVLTTWCAGAGAAWAERRTDISVQGQVLMQGTAMWVPVNRLGVPVRLQPEFFSVYAEASQVKTSSRVPSMSVGDNAVLRNWFLRAADIDIVNHLNNAAAWQAVTEFAPQAEEVVVVHHQQIELGEAVTVEYDDHHILMKVNDEVRISFRYA